MHKQMLLSQISKTEISAVFIITHLALLHIIITATITAGEWLRLMFEGIFPMIRNIVYASKSIGSIEDLQRRLSD
jgi:hypothetical protein